MEYNEKIRLIIADDSFFIRTYLSELLRQDPDILLVGTASTGNEVVALASKMKPDVITMDYHMPGLNGIEATAEIMLGGRPLPAIIMISAFEGEDGAAMRKSLAASGAHVINKPSGEISLDIEKAAEEILRKVKEIGMVEVKMRKLYARMHHQTEKNQQHAPRGSRPLRGVVVIGASTGGPPLVESLISALDPELDIAIVVVQHMSPYFSGLFAERLDRVTGYRVHQAVSGEALVSGVGVVVPGGYSLFPSSATGTKDAEESCSFLLSPTPINQHEIEIDETMKGIAACYGASVVGVLLSGMGVDGTEGLRAIKSHGGFALVQNPETATISSMPRHAAHAETMDAMLDLSDIPACIKNYFSFKA